MSRFSTPELLPRRSVITGRGAEVNDDQYHMTDKDVENLEMKKKVALLEKELADMRQKIAEKEVERIHEEDENEDIEQPVIIDENEEDIKTVEWLKGNNVANPSNPGKLVINGKAKFIFNKICGDILHYHCSKKSSHKCRSKAKVMRIDGDGNNVEYEVISVDRMENHNCKTVG